MIKPQELDKTAFYLILCHYLAIKRMQMEISLRAAIQKCVYKWWYNFYQLMFLQQVSCNAMEGHKKQLGGWQKFTILL